MKSIHLPMKNFEWGGGKHSLIFDEIKKAVARIAQSNYYNPTKDTRVNCDASLSGLWATLEQRIANDEWVPIAFASRYLNTQEKKHSTNVLELRAVVWSVDRFKYYHLGKEFVIKL